MTANLKELALEIVDLVSLKERIEKLNVVLGKLYNAAGVTIIELDNVIKIHQDCSFPPKELHAIHCAWANAARFVVIKGLMIVSRTSNSVFYFNNPDEIRELIMSMEDCDPNNNIYSVLYQEKFDLVVTA